MVEGSSDYVWVFTDESYVNLNHSSKNSYSPKDPNEATIHKKSGKGKRLIILHAITEDGLLVEIDPTTGRPVDDLEWNKDTCHPKKRRFVIM